MSTSNPTSNSTGSPRQHTAGLLDIRNIIGGLLGIYGVILVLMGIFADPQEGKTGGVNANLWAGIALLVVSAIFIAWAKLRPVEVPEDAAASAEPGEAPAHMDAR
ncbi:hypothetical protein [Nocardioides panaciterrulae]|uniref:Uncharacterized protein n=1 Tax=Nocardioides panaciterrulae TaxID=661492 RepID=A0A7Y9E2Y7_9ACTN|nr:hypothetical protein [Nocardioides panaciterrulae]NYD40273.1 hypothetical protein [Nocardioides panaciterrulae]